ncbi:MAG: PAS domain S-box protein [Bacteroidota bacterium]
MSNTKFELSRTEAEIHLAKIAENTLDVIWFVDPDLIFRYFSPSIKKMLGYESAELIGQNLNTIIADTSVPVVSQAFESLISRIKTKSITETSQPKVIEIQAIKKDQSLVWLENSVSKLFDDKGELSGFIGVTRDVSDRKNAETLLHDSEEKYRTLFVSMAQGVVYQDSEGQIFLANPAAERILGLTSDQMAGRTSVDPRWHAIHEDGSPFPGETHPAMVTLKTGRESMAVMGVFNPETGTYSWINVNAQPQFKPGEEKPFQVFTTFEDLTPLRENLSELNRANQRLEVLRKMDHAIMRSKMNEHAVDELAMESILRMIPCAEVQLVTFDFEKEEACIESGMIDGQFDSSSEKKLPLNLFDTSHFTKGNAYCRNIGEAEIISKGDELLLQKGIKSVISVPMIDNDRLIGVFALMANETNHFTPDDLQIAEDIANQILLNLRQRELYLRLQQDTTDLEKLVKVRTKELQAILNAVPDLLFRINRQGIFLELSSGDPNHLLLPANQFIGKSYGEVMPPEIAVIGLKALEEAFRTQEKVTFEFELLLHGEHRSYEARNIVIAEDEALSIIRDITESKQAQHDLRWNESLLQKMASTSPLAFFVVDNRTDAILYFNHQFCEIWGITHLEQRIQIGELKNNDIIPDCLQVLKDVPAFAESCKPLQDEFNEVVIEDEIPFQDGRTIRRFSAQIRGEKNEYFGRLYIFEDISLRKTTEQFIRIQRDLASRHSTMTSMSEALSLSLTALLQIEGVDCGGIYLLDSAEGKLSLVAHHGLSAEFIAETSFYDQDSPQTALVKEGVVLYLNFSESELLRDPVMEKEGLLSLALLPMQYEGEVIGCINIGSKTRTDFFDKIRFSLEALAIQIGGTISRINAETLLKRSQQNFQVLFDTIDDFMFILDARGFIIRTNPVVRKRLGYTDEELNKLNVLEVHPPDRREEAGFIVGEMLAGRALFCPVPLITKEGILIPVETRVVMGKWDEKDVLFGISRDITEHLKAETALMMQSAAFESFALPIIITDPNGNITWANTAFLNLSGYAMEEILNLSPGELVKSGEQSKEFYKAFWETINTGMVWSGELINRKKDGTLYPEELTITPVLDQGGRISSFIAIKIDISSRKQYEESLRESIEKEKELSSMRSKFISVASHEFRTPLATIMATSESLLSYRHKMTEKQQDERFGKIKEQVVNLSKIIEEILSLSKLQTKERELEPELFDIPALTMNLIEEFRVQAGREIAIDFQSVPESIEVKLDKKNIQLVISNLLSNAIKYSVSGNTIFVTLNANEEEVILTVRDQGIGIPEEEIKLLFTPFYRASNVANIKGTGLGLNIVKESVQRHGGKITLKSKLNEGSLFKVSLPRTITNKFSA